jgi:hypothetical protein
MYKKLFGACTSLYQLVQARKVGKVPRVKARSKTSQVISENSCRSEGRVIKVILSHRQTLRIRGSLDLSENFDNDVPTVSQQIISDLWQN